MSVDFEIKNAVCLVTPQLSDQMCILGRDWSLKIPRLARTLHNTAKTVKKMSGRVHEFPTVLRTNINGQKTKLNVIQNNKSPICGEIMFSVQPNPKHATVLNPDSIIALLDTIDTNETSQVIEVRARLEKELENCSAESLSDLTPMKNFDYAFEIKFLNPLQKPIAFKSLPLPFHLKTKVKKSDRGIKNQKRN